MFQFIRKVSGQRVETATQHSFSTATHGTARPEGTMPRPIRPGKNKESRKQTNAWLPAFFLSDIQNATEVIF